MFIKQNYLVFFFSLLFLSCSKNNSSFDNNEIPSLTQGKIKKTEEIRNNVIVKTSEFTYNDYGNISKLLINDGTKIYETIFNYNSGNLMVSWNLKEYYIGNLDNKTEQLNTLNYINGKIDNICIDRSYYPYLNSVAFRSSDRIKFNYTSSILPISIVHYYPYDVSPGNSFSCSDVLYISNTETFTYLNENTIRYESGQNLLSNNYNIFEYDAKKHYQSNIKPDVFKNSLGYSTKNNIVKAYVYNSSNVLQGISNYDNTYNINDFPVKTIEKYYPVGSINPTNTYQTNYYYY